jgi:hypothetical protein
MCHVITTGVVGAMVCPDRGESTTGAAGGVPAYATVAAVSTSAKLKLRKDMAPMTPSPPAMTPGWSTTSALDALPSETVLAQSVEADGGSMRLVFLAVRPRTCRRLITASMKRKKR